MFGLAARFQAVDSVTICQATLSSELGRLACNGAAIAEVQDRWGAVRFSGAAGRLRADRDTCAESTSRCHVASVTKTMTAVIILQLLESGLLGPNGLNSRLESFDIMPPDLLRRLNRYSGSDQGQRITLRHLLMHTSGMRDAMVDDAVHLGSQAGGIANDSLIGRWVSQMKLDPSYGRKTWRSWDAQNPSQIDAGVINHYLNLPGLSEAALGAPGDRFHYSDTGYVLLALVAEKVTAKPLGQLFRDRIFDPLGMQSSYLAYCNDPPDVRRTGFYRVPEADVWFGDMPLLSSGISLQFDRGGGGVVASMGDLVRFMRGLLGHKLFAKPTTLPLMCDWQKPHGLTPPRTGVGFGLFRSQVGGVLLLGHSGAWGTRMCYLPKTGLYYAATVNRAGMASDWDQKLLTSLDTSS